MTKNNETYRSIAAAIALVLYAGTAGAQAVSTTATTPANPASAAPAAVSPLDAWREPQGLSYGARAGLGYSDNVGLTDDPTQESVYYSLGGTLQWARDQGRLQGRANADLDWVDYFESGYDSQLYGNLNANLRYALIEDRLDWIVEDGLGQGSSDPFASPSPGNTETINYFSTGPDLTFRFGAVTGVTLGGRYANAWYEESVNDNDRYSGSLELFRLLGNQSRAFARGNYENVQFDNPSTFNRDYERVDGSVGYSGSGTRTSVSLEGGYTQLDYDDGTSQDGPLVRLSLSRVLSSSFEVSLRAGYEFNDSALDQRYGNILAPEPDGSDTIAVSDVYEDRYGGGELRFKRQRTSLAFGAEFHDEDYVTEDQLDRKTLRFFVGGDRQMSRTTALRADVNWTDSNYAVNDIADYDDWSAGVGLVWQLSGALALDFGYRRAGRSDGLYGGYDENRIWVRAEWTPGGSRKDDDNPEL